MINFIVFSVQYNAGITLLTKIAAAQNEVAVSYYRVRGLYSLAVIFAAAIVKGSV